MRSQLLCSRLACAASNTDYGTRPPFIDFARQRLQGGYCVVNQQQAVAECGQTPVATNTIAARHGGNGAAIKSVRNEIVPVREPAIETCFFVIRLREGKEQFPLRGGPRIDREILYLFVKQLGAQARRGCAHQFCRASNIHTSLPIPFRPAVTPANHYRPRPWKAAARDPRVPPTHCFDQAC